MLATNGDTHLGGEDFDQRVMQYFLKMIKKKNGTDITGDNRALQKLRREVWPVLFCPDDEGRDIVGEIVTALWGGRWDAGFSFFNA